MTNSNERGRRVGASTSHTRLDALEAASVDAKVSEILRAARARGATNPAATEASIRERDEFMDQMRQGAVTALISHALKKELIPESDLTKMLRVNRKWILNAVQDNRLFSIRTPSGEEYFPAFYGDSVYDRAALELACQKLGGLPGPSKYYFFTSKSTYLGCKTPLEALAAGMRTEVLIAAEAFAQR